MQSAFLRVSVLRLAAAAVATVLFSFQVVHAQTPCVVPDNGGGTITLPPAGCGYLSPDDVHAIIDGLPPGTTIEVGAHHADFFCPMTPNVCSFPPPAPGMRCDQSGGGLGGEQECAGSTLQLQMVGTGMLAGFMKNMNFPVEFETHVAPRMPGDPSQSFDTDMFRLFGQVVGDPDFDLLRITAGTDFGLPSPGHTTLTQLPGGNWAVDSFFDITYRIDFVGAPGGPLMGLAGSTTGTIRMQAGVAGTRDHYTSYQIAPVPGGPAFQPFGPIQLGDQFGVGAYHVIKPVALLPPADKNSEGVYDSFTHLKEYKLKPLQFSLPHLVQIDNQCHSALLAEIGKPVSILVPTNKSLVAPPPPPTPGTHFVDHFLCYKPKAKVARGTQVDVVDQFNARRYDVRKVKKVCVPANKQEVPGLPPVIFSTGEVKTITPAQIINGVDHLVCYQARLAKYFVPQLGCGCDIVADPTCVGALIVPAQVPLALPQAFLNNQFGPEQVQTRKLVEFCVPSRKTVL